MKNQRVINLKVGIFVLISLLIFMVFIFALGGKSSLLKKTYKIRTSFTNTAGLSEGAPVRLSGLRIGSVKEIKFPENPDNNFIVVTMEVNEEGIRRIGSAEPILLMPSSFTSIVTTMKLLSGFSGNLISLTLPIRSPESLTGAPSESPAVFVNEVRIL